MSGNGVNYPKVVDLLADTIKELNQPCVAETPAAPAERTAAERTQDAADVLRGLLHQLEGGDAAAAAAAAAAAEHDATDDGLTGRVKTCVDLYGWLRANGWSRSQSVGAAKEGGFTRDEANAAAMHVWGVQIKTYAPNTGGQPNFFIEG